MGSFFKNLRNKMERFMCGRYGLVQLGRFLSGALMVCLLLSLVLEQKRRGPDSVFCRIFLADLVLFPHVFQKHGQTVSGKCKISDDQKPDQRTASQKL